MTGGTVTVDADDLEEIIRAYHDWDPLERTITGVGPIAPVTCRCGWVGHQARHPAHVAHMAHEARNGRLR